MSPARPCRMARKAWAAREGPCSPSWILWPGPGRTTLIYALTAGHSGLRREERQKLDLRQVNEDARMMKSSFTDLFQVPVRREDCKNI